MRTFQLLFCLIVFTNCAADDNFAHPNPKIIMDPITKPSDSIKHYLALGDSYTVGESVSSEMSFPAQLKTCLKQKFQIELEIIATTGWTTSDLIKSIEKGTKRTSYELVTLLIGVNNQYQGKAFKVYEDEFTDLLNRSIKLVNGNKKNVIVVSIPDYAYTTFGQGSEKISKEIDKYNAFAEKTAKAMDVKFVNITDITRDGIKDPELVARDGLHPSAKAYQKFVERLCPVVSNVLGF